MTCRTIKTLSLASLILVAASAFGAGTSGFDLSLLVDHVERPEYSSRGTVYIEALHGKSYELRVTNPLPYRVAVALSVDGLNTIDAKHTSSGDASKWIIEPYGSIVISGWQVNDRTARKFFFTSENKSYGAALGQTDNLGVIEAVYYRERVRRPPVVIEQPQQYRDAPSGTAQNEAAPSSAARSESAGAAPTAPAPMDKKAELSDDFAATGMGARKNHQIEQVDIDLEEQPIASVRMRYEFRPQLVELGVFPLSPSPIERREAAKGFGSYCPQPN